MGHSRTDILVRTVVARGGVARVADLQDRGFRRGDITRGVECGAIVRVRPGWIAVPDADPLLVGAARHGVVLSCVTQARRLGLWVHQERPAVHVAAPPRSSGGKPASLRVHWALPVVPRHPGALEDQIENVLALVAECEPFEQALATWESALNKGTVNREVLGRLARTPASRRLFADALPFADAGLETYVRTRLAWLRIPITFQIWIAGHRVDTLIGARLVIQTDGASHVGAQRSEDIRHDAELRLMGYHVIRVSYRQMMDQWHVVQDLIMRAVALGLHT